MRKQILIVIVLFCLFSSYNALLCGYTSTQNGCGSCNTLYGSDCNACSVSGYKINLKGDGCVPICPGASQASTTTPSTCMCPAGQYKTSDYLDCVTACSGATALVNLKGDACIAACEDGTDTSGICGCGANYKTFDFLACTATAACPTGQFLNSAGKTCVKACATGEVIDLSGIKCAASCPSGSSNSSGTCVCPSGQYKNAAKTGCVATCTAGTDYINFKKDGCEACASNAGGYCTCASGTDKIKSDFSGCNATCGTGEFISTDLKYCVTSCGTDKISISGTKCVSACETDAVADGGTPNTCKCTTAGKLFKNSGFTACISSCPAAESTNLKGDGCVAAGVSSGVTCTANTPCACTTSTDYIQPDYQSCNTVCPTGYLLNSAGTTCVKTCSGSEKINLTGDKCVASCPANASVSSTSPSTCICTGTNKYINTAATDCASTCGTDKISLKGDKCVSSTSYTVGTTDCSGSQCVCKPNNLMLEDYSDCTATCPSAPTQTYVNLKGDRCVSVCPSLSPFDTSYNCACVGYNYLKNVDYSNCINACDSSSSQKINLAGTTCLASSTSCPGTSQVSNGACSCPGSVTANILKNSALNDCTATCTGGESINLKGDACITTANCPTNGPNSSGTCTCNTGSGFLYKKSDFSDCTATCGLGEKINLKGDKCLAYGVPCDGSKSIASTDGKYCTCPTAYPYKNTGYTDCANTCQSSEKINLKGDYCLGSSVNCPTNTDTISTTPGPSTCVCKSAFPIKLADYSDCAASCAGKISLKGDVCVADCSGYANADSSQPQCTCTGDYPYISSDYKICQNSCVQSSELITISGKGCISTTDCTTANGKSQNGKCACTGTNNLKSYDLKSCVSACTTVGSTTIILNLKGDGCITDTVCIGSSIKGATSPSTNPTKCVCTASSFPLKSEDQSSCVATCSNKINFDNSQCVPTCRGEILQLTSTQQCKKLLDSNNALVSNICTTSGTPEGYNNRCNCLPTISGATSTPNYLDTTGVSCAGSCSSGKINLLGTQCTATSTTEQSNTGSQIICASPSNVLNIRGDDCIPKSSCTLLNLQQTQCVAVCDFGSPDTSASPNVCVCPVGQFKSSSGKQCVLKCGTTEIIDVAGSSCIDGTTGTTSCNTANSKQINLYNDKCNCKSGFYADYTATSSGYNACIACTTIANQVVNLKGDKCLAFTLAATACPNGSSMVAGSTSPAVANKCACNKGFVRAADDLSCIAACPTGQVYSADYSSCVIANCDLYQKNIYDGYDKSKCLLCANGYGVQDGLCVLNSNTGNIANCRQYQKNSDGVTYKCILCYCDFALSNDGSKCVSNQQYLVQGCHQYDAYMVCKICRATWKDDFRPFNSPQAKEYEQNYMIVDLGLRPLASDGVSYECVDNMDTTLIQGCATYDINSNCLTCHLNLPFTKTGESTKRCLKNLFYNSDKCNDYNTDGRQYNICKCKSDSYINYPSDTIYYTTPYDPVNFPGFTFNGCVKPIADCLFYDVSGWKTGDTSKDPGCLQCKNNKIPTYDKMQCVPSQALYCNFSKSSVDADVNNCHATACGRGLQYITITGIDGISNQQCGAINQCKIQKKDSSSWPLKDNCDTCFPYYKQFIDGSKVYCVYNQKSAPGFVSDSACDTTLGFGTTPATVSGNKVCQCSSSPSTQQLVINSTTKVLTLQPAAADTVTSVVRPPINVGVCRNLPISAGPCIDSYDNTGKCKRCASGYWRSAAWNCVASGTAPSDFTNCEEIFKDNVNIWCRKCSKGYGMIFGIKLSAGSIGASSQFSYASNGYCTNTSDGAILSKYVVIDCIVYDQIGGIPQLDGTGNLKCLQCRDGYKLASSTSCVKEEDLGCDFYYQFYSTDSAIGKYGNGNCECATGTTALYSRYTYDSVIHGATRRATCIANNYVIKYCYLYYTADANYVITTSTKCAKCITGEQNTGAGLTTCREPSSSTCTLTSTPTSCFSITSTTKTQCVTFYGRINLGASTSTVPSADTIYDYQYKDDFNACVQVAYPAPSNQVQFCLRQKSDGTGCLECKAGFVPYRTNGDITQCNPIIKGCIIFDTTQASTPLATTIKASKCVRCAPQFTEVYVGAGFNDLICDDPSDQIVLVQEQAGDSDIAFDQEPHPGCLKVQTKKEELIYDTTPDIYYTRSCAVCRDPYHLGFIGQKIIQTTDGIFPKVSLSDYDVGAGVFDKIGCILNTIEHCYSYDQTISTSQNGYTISSKTFGKCTKCFAPFRLWTNTDNGLNYCILEGCTSPKITTDNAGNKSVDLTQCGTCDNSGIDYPYYLTSTFNTNKSVCKRHTLQITNCAIYSPTTDQICLTCSSNYYWQPNTSPKQCMTCSVGQYYNLSENATSPCINYNQGSAKNCATQSQQDRCNTCSSGYYPVYSDTTDSRYIVTCLASGDNCLEYVKTSTGQYCSKCFAFDPLLNKGYGFVDDSSTPASCIDNTNNIQFCYQYYAGSSPQRCKQCIQIVTVPNDASQYYGLIPDSQNLVQCINSEPFCKEYLIYDSTTSPLTYKCKPAKCDENYAQNVLDDLNLFNRCLVGCKRSYANKYCAKCHPGFTLSSMNSYSKKCYWNHDFEFYDTTANTRVRYCAQYNFSPEITGDDSTFITQLQALTGTYCQTCKDGYVLVQQQNNKDLKCVKKYGSCNLDGCFALYPKIKTDDSSPVYANAEMLRCHYIGTPSAGTYNTNDLTYIGNKDTNSQLYNSIYSRNQGGCLINSTDSTNTVRQYQFNKRTKKCDYYAYQSTSDKDAMIATPNDGSQATFGTTDLSCKGNDGGLAPEPYVPPTPSTSSSTITPTPSTSTTSSSFSDIFNFGLNTFILVVFSIIFIFM